MLSHVDVVKRMKDFVVSDSVEHQLNALISAVNQLLLNVQVSLCYLPSEIYVVSFIKH